MLARQKSHQIKSWFQTHFSELWRAILLDRGADDINEDAHKALAEILLLYPLFGESLDALFDAIPTEEMEDIADMYFERSFALPQSFRMLAPSALVLRREIIARGNTPTFADSLAAYQMRSVAYENLELSPMRYVDCCYSKAWFSGQPLDLPSSALQDALRFLTQPVIVTALNSKYVYTVTHILFYLLEFGRSDVQILGDAHAPILTNLRIMAEFARANDDRDVLAELLVCWHLCDGEMDAEVKAWTAYLSQAENGDCSLSRFGEPGTNGEFFDCYHTTLVYLWAVLLGEHIAPCGGFRGSTFDQATDVSSLTADFCRACPEIGTHDPGVGQETFDLTNMVRSIIDGDLAAIHLPEISESHPLFLSVQIEVIKLVALLARHYENGGVPLEQIDIFQYLDWLDASDRGRAA